MRGLRIALVVLAAVYAHATSLPIVPTTTLTAETGNNTAAASAWTTSGSGDIAPANVSKVNHRTLLYPGATTQLYSNIMFWFGPSNHIQVGYRSDDYNQVKKQVDDHLSRGINGTIVDWYGTAHTVDNTATLYLKQYAESLAGYPFQFAIMEDKGALNSCAHTTGCDVNAQLVSDLTYIVSTYGESPAYMKFNGQPVIFFFALESYAINWDWVKSQVPGNPLFIFENSSAYTHPDTDGAFGWVMINSSNPLDWKQSYLDSFYQAAQSYSAQHTFGAVYKGFNDTLASWSLNRIMSQQCGQVWLNTWNEVGKYYGTANQLESMQIVTWNDYEEGTEIETGIDNCLTIGAGVSGTTLSWTVNGNENTLDHYTVFVSTDGQNLMPLADVAAGLHALDLPQFGIGPGNYALYVKAVGKPSFINQMSPAVSLTVGNQAPRAALTLTANSGSVPLTLTASSASSTDPDGSIASSKIDFGDGGIALTNAATHTYTAAGTYTVKATVTDNMGASSSTSATVTVTAPTGVTVLSPAASTNVSAAVHFVASAYSTNPITAMLIYVDNQSAYTVNAGSLDTSLNLIPGPHNVVVQAWDSTGAVFKNSFAITVVDQPPGASLALSSTSIVAGAPVAATLNGSDPDGTITGYRINFGDGTSAATAGATHTYAAPGTYTVTGVVTDNAGLTATASATVTVAPSADSRHRRSVR